MIKKPVDNRPQVQLKTVIWALDQHGGIAPLRLPKKLVYINLDFQNPKVSVANHHRNNLKPIAQPYTRSFADLPKQFFFIARAQQDGLIG